MGSRIAVMPDGPVAVRFEFKTEADAIAIADQLQEDGLATAVDIRTADGRTHEFDAYRAELVAKQQKGG
jgi:acyl-CoA reductase-like NAD-dependent aldehyde dehydrogenase